MTTADTLFDRPVFIVSSPRSGSSLLFLTLADAPHVFTIGGESHQLIEGLPGLHPIERDWTSNALSATDATPGLRAELPRRFHAALRDRAARPPAGRVRMIEKTPKNSLRVPFLDAIFPDAIFVYLYREPRETLASMIEAWRTGRFATYARLPGWTGLPWSLLLIPGWRDLIGRPLPEIAAWQWATTTDLLLDDLAGLPAERVRAVSYAALIADPQATMRALAASLDLGWDRALGEALPYSPTIVTAPRAGKWRDHADALADTVPMTAAADARACEMLARYDVIERAR